MHLEDHLPAIQGDRLLWRPIDNRTSLLPIRILTLIGDAPFNNLDYAGPTRKARPVTGIKAWRVARGGQTSW
jgi:hypothetical protein